MQLDVAVCMLFLRLHVPHLSLSVVLSTYCMSPQTDIRYVLNIMYFCVVYLGSSLWYISTRIVTESLYKIMNINEECKTNKWNNE